MKSREIHGMTYTRLYHTWKAMKGRCNCETSQDYVYYGGRGVTVCDDWNESFVSFMKWSMDNGYEDSLEIDRVDVNGGYNPENCQWITRSENVAVGKKRRYKSNKSGITGVSWFRNSGKWSSRITIQGKTICLGHYYKLEDALTARISAEILYFGEQRTNLKGGNV